MKRSLKILSVLSLSLALCVACSSHKKGDAASTEGFALPADAKVLSVTGKKGGHIVLPAASNFDSLNPIVTNDIHTHSLLNHLYLPLVDINPITLQEDLALAKSIVASDDKLQFTIQLRRGLQWSDGAPFSADDVLFSYQVMTDPKILSPRKDTFKQADESFPLLEKLDNDTIRFTLKEINAMFIGSLYDFQIIPKHRWEKTYNDGQFMNAMLINEDPKGMPVMGPYMLDEYSTDQRVVLRRNPYFFMVDKEGQRLPYLDKVIYLIVPDFNALLVKFQNGETDMHEVRPEEYDLLKGLESKGTFTLHEIGPGYSTYYFQLNQNTSNSKKGVPYLNPNKKKLFTDKRFRQALSYAMDRSGIVKMVFQGRATAITSLESPANILWRNPHPKEYPYDLAKADALLNEIGIRDTNGDGIREYADGTPVTLTIKTNVENKTRVQIGNMLKQDFRKIGIETSLSPIPWTSLLEVLKSSHDFDAVIAGWASGLPPDPITNKNVTLSSGQSHYWFPAQEHPATDWEKRMDELVLLNQRTFDLKERQKFWREFLAIWEDELPEIMIAAPNVYAGANKKFGNVKPSPFTPLFEWNLHEIYDTSL